MDARGQVYADLAEHIPAEDQKRLIAAQADYDKIAAEALERSRAEVKSLMREVDLRG